MRSGIGVSILVWGDVGVGKEGGEGTGKRTAVEWSGNEVHWLKFKFKLEFKLAIKLEFKLSSEFVCV